jgi:hypothetical protein
MQISFSYPESWTLIKECPDYVGGAKLYLSNGGILMCLSRKYDTVWSRHTETEIVEREKSRSEGDSLFFHVKTTVGDNTCLKVVHIKRANYRFDDEIQYFCPEKMFSISINYKRQEGNQTSKCTLTVDKILGSFVVKGDGVSYYVYINDGKCRDCKDSSLSGWRTYENKEIGISFAYPATWKITPVDHSSDDIVELVGNRVKLRLGKPSDSAGLHRFYGSASLFGNMIAKNPTLKKRLTKFAGDTCTEFSYIEQRKTEITKIQNLWSLNRGIHASVSWHNYSADRDTVAAPVIDRLLSSVSVRKRGAQ